eukprot:TRINITY_DN6201_c0_g1_i1.p2 TRINITY_DN6201_c0_g1~~TRINITY_DN6201_c0_g1_i1.p2  ORF type:complete len:106 (-),score=14.02 TRINITY_DN6201_c0_g1_i1:627-944(-)
MVFFVPFIRRLTTIGGSEGYRYATWREALMIGGGLAACAAATGLYYKKKADEHIVEHDGGVLTEAAKKHPALYQRFDNVSLDLSDKAIKENDVLHRKMSYEFKQK